MNVQPKKWLIKHKFAIHNKLWYNPQGYIYLGDKPDDASGGNTGNTIDACGG